MSRITEEEAVPRGLHTNKLLMCSKCVCKQSCGFRKGCERGEKPHEVLSSKTTREVLMPVNSTGKSSIIAIVLVAVMKLVVVVVQAAGAEMIS